MNRATMAVDARPTRTEELVQELVRRERGFHQLPADLSTAEQGEIRRLALERVASTALPNIGHYSLDAERAARTNCENFIGIAQIPMGVVGPLTLYGDEGLTECYVPLATTEAALVASTNRGCAAIRKSGGATVMVEDAGMTRAPVFRTSGAHQVREFLEWVEEHVDDMREVAESTSRYLRLLDVRPKTFGTSVLLRFRYSTGDAMGMNMVTIATDRVVEEVIEPNTGVECVALSGNYCVDKKPAQVNFQEGRGKRIHAEVVLDEPVLSRVLKTDAQALVEVNYRKNLLGSIAAGSLGFNAHYANILAGFFVATGQDIAHVVEGSMGVTCVERRGDEGVYFSVSMPDVPLGVVGGGTMLDTQREGLAILGIAPDPERPGRAVRRLAEVVGAVVLAGELSLMAAFTSRDLARAHDRFRRGDHPRGRLPVDG